jgi:hypothetical protein
MKFFLVFLTAFSITAANAQQRKTHTTTTHTSTSSSTANSASPSTYSFASDTEHEVVLNPSKVSIESYKEAKSRTDITIYGAYNHHLMDSMQVGGEGGIVPGTDTKGNSKALIAAMGTFTWNFSFDNFANYTNLRDAFFLQAGLGLYPAYNKDDGSFDSKISTFGGFGKRFEVWGKINYMPYARLWKRGSEDMRLDIEALNFSIFY